MISLDEHLDHYPHYITSKEVSSISSRYQSFSSSAAFLQARVTTYTPNLPLILSYELLFLIFNIKPFTQKGN